MHRSSKFKIYQTRLLSVLELPKPWSTQILLAVSLPLCLFSLSLTILDESEVLFALFHIFFLAGIAFVLDLFPAIVAAALIDLSIDFHYIKPLGTVLESSSAFGIMGCCGVIVFAMRMLRNSIISEHVARVASERAVKIRENILAMVSHDLRQPLSAANLATQLIKRSLETENTGQVEKFNEIIRNSLEKIDEMIGDLVDAAKTDSGNFTVNLQELELRSYLSKTLDQFAIQAHAKRIDLELFFFEKNETEWVFADPGPLSRVLSNFISNALKFAPTSGKILVEVKNSDTGEIVISVCDTGPGVKDESIGQLFQRNWQEKSSAHLGSGLGLYICKGIIEAHGGKVWYEKRLNWGACFCLTIRSRPPIGLRVGLADESLSPKNNSSDQNLFS